MSFSVIAGKNHPSISSLKTLVPTNTSVYKLKSIKDLKHEADVYIFRPRELMEFQSMVASAVQNYIQGCIFPRPCGTRETLRVDPHQWSTRRTYPPLPHLQSPTCKHIIFSSALLTSKISNHFNTAKYKVKCYQNKGQL